MGEAPVPAEQPPAGQAARVSPPHVDPGRPGNSVGAPTQGSSSAVRLIQPISDRATFALLRQSKRRVRRGPVTVSWVEGEPSEPTRVAYTVGRRVGGAVVRNRVRRRLRSVVAESQECLRPGPYLIGVGAEAARSSYAELKAAVSEALDAVAVTPAPRQKTGR